jgi:hypothetical protein
MPPIAEPTTMLTDYALAVLGFWLGGRLLRQGRREWAFAFWAMAMGAALGGTSHGFALVLSPTWKQFLWKATVYSIGLVSYFVLAAMARSVVSGGALRTVQALALLKLAVYWWWMASHDEFRYVIYDYGPSLLAALLVGLWVWRFRGMRGGVWIAAGVAVSFAGAGVQLSGFALHRHFNHNDLYHVIQMAGLWLLYCGARSLPDVQGASAEPAHTL